MRAADEIDARENGETPRDHEARMLRDFRRDITRDLSPAGPAVLLIFVASIGFLAVIKAIEDAAQAIIGAADRRATTSASQRKAIAEKLGGGGEK